MLAKLLAAIGIVAFAPAVARADAADDTYYDCLKNWKSLAGEAGPSLVAMVADPSSKMYTYADHAETEAAFAKIDASCAAECKGIAPPARIPKHALTAIEMPEHWCKAGADRKALLRQSVINGMTDTRGATSTVDVEKIRAEYVRKDGYWSEWTADAQDLAVRRAAKRERFAKAGYAKKWKDVGMTDAEVDAIVESTMEYEVARWKILEELALTFTFPKKGNKDAKLEKMARAVVAKEIKGAKILATIMNEKTYKVRVNAFGVPVERWKDGSILFKVPGETFCRQEGFSYTEGYSGRKYTPSPSVRMNLWRYVDCKNIK